MTKQLEDLIAGFTQSSNNEAIELVREIRHNKSIAKPAAQKRAVKAQKKRTATAKSKASKLLKGLTKEQKADILKQFLKGDD